jgi:hypothetical protein
MRPRRPAHEAVRCWLLLAACGLRPAPALAANQDAIVGQEVVTAHLSPLHAATALDHDQAVRAAQQFVPDHDQATAVDARLVALTMRDQHGAIAWNMQARPVWLVLFDGVAYQPASGPDAGCACSQYGDRPNTAVALDPRSGALVLTYGFTSQP